MPTITPDKQAAIAKFLDGRYIPAGIGDKEQACSIAAINLALTGQLTDNIPLCMSPVIGRWIIVIQDAMPDDMRNSSEWRQMLPLAAGTGRDADLEAKRISIILGHMWGVTLPHIQNIADKYGFGDEWRTMIEKKSAAAAAYAADAAYAAAAYADVAYAAYAAAAYADVAYAAYAADAAAASAARAARAASAARAAYAADAWAYINPAALLGRLIEAN